LEFWASSESDAASFGALDRVRRSVEPVLQEMLASSNLAAANLRFRYVPIVMTDEILDQYPARSRAQLKQRILDCAPQLDRRSFIHGSFGDQVQTYVEGIRTALPLLPKFGLSPTDVRDFEALLAKVVDRFAS
jgi:hypothetical protein